MSAANPKRSNMERKPDLTEKDANRILSKAGKDRNYRHKVVKEDGTVDCTCCGRTHPASALLDGVIRFSVPSKLTIEKHLYDHNGRKLGTTVETRIVNPSTIRGLICSQCAYTFNAVSTSKPAAKGFTNIKRISHWNSREQRIAAQAAELDIETARRNLIEAGMPEWAALYAAVVATANPDTGTWAHTGNPEWIANGHRLLQGEHAALAWPSEILWRAWRKDQNAHWKMDWSTDVSDGRWRGFYESRDPGLRYWHHRPLVQPSGQPAPSIRPVDFSVTPLDGPVAVRRGHLAPLPCLIPSGNSGLPQPALTVPRLRIPTIGHHTGQVLVRVPHVRPHYWKEILNPSAFAHRAGTAAFYHPIPKHRSLVRREPA